MNRLSLTNNHVLKASLVNRWPQLILLAVMLAAFLFAILSGLIGTPVGSHNFSIVFIWIAWWGILILIAVPFFGRGWCAICPIPLPGEWLQRGRVLGPENFNREGHPSTSLRTGSEHKGFLNNNWGSGSSRWPRVLRNIWLQNASFLLVALFSSVILTTPLVTSIVLAAMLFLAIGLSMIFQRRAFCRYLCPVGGFIGLYAQAAPLELRIKDKAVCGTCEGKPCYNGSSAGYGCPWDVFPGGMTKNTYCGLCLECLRTCPHDNIAINARPFAADLAKPLTRLDEAYKAFIMLGSAMIYAGVLLGPWGALKNVAYNIFRPEWFAYAFAFLAIIFIVMPSLFALCVTQFENL